MCEDSAERIARDDLDAWQKFAYDLVCNVPRQGKPPLRMMLHGSAGTGKSRTVRAFVASLRDRVAVQYAGKIAAAKRGGNRNRAKGCEEELKEKQANVALLAAPTGCASFQLKYGASTLHRIFGIPVGYCGPFSKGTGDRNGRWASNVREDGFSDARCFWPLGG